MVFMSSVATTSAVAASLLPIAIGLSKSSYSSSSASQSFRVPKPQNLSFLSSSSPNPNPLFLSTSLTNSPSALHMDVPTSEHKSSFQSDDVLPELLTKYMVNMKCKGCVEAVKNKLRVVDDFLVSTAVAEFKDPYVFGVVRFAQVNMELARIEANFSGLSPEKHGWSINEFGDLTKGVASTGKVFNPSTVGVNKWCRAYCEYLFWLLVSMIVAPNWSRSESRRVDESYHERKNLSGTRAVVVLREMFLRKMKELEGAGFHGEDDKRRSPGGPDPRHH